MGLSHNIIKGLNVARAIGVVSRQSATGTKCIFNTSINRSPKEVLLSEKATETKCVVNGKLATWHVLQNWVCRLLITKSLMEV